GNLIPKRKAIPFAVVNPVHCRLSPTRPFSERSPTYKRLPTLMIADEIFLLFDYSDGKHLIR
ncbi:MAG: hypothetical protein LBK82_09350, partial [Planctomycetaceae bacterium]|nr:hypothetical protein [Planctomycetaceae bacterium]